jgi:hypothetical protein
MRHATELGRAVALRLQPSGVEAVVVKVVGVVLIAVAALAYGGGALVTPPPVTSSQSARPVVSASRDSASDADVDSYGNEVTPAVAEYSLDPAGNPYELHAPQIELPRLAPPQS